jgi:serine/threonine protein kinase
MGEVYLAEDPQVERKVAIKILQLPINSETDAGLRLFKKELQALAHLNRTPL